MVLRKWQAVGCKVIGLHEVRKPGRTGLVAAECRVSPVGSGQGKRWIRWGLIGGQGIDDQNGDVGSGTHQRTPHATFELAGESSADTSFVAYAPTDTPKSREGRYVTWNESHRIVNLVPNKRPSVFFLGP